MCVSACLAHLQALVPGCDAELDWVMERLSQMLACIGSP